jgi:hypothetical protein
MDTRRDKSPGGGQPKVLVMIPTAGIDLSGPVKSRAACLTRLGRHAELVRFPQIPLLRWKRGSPTGALICSSVPASATAAKPEANEAARALAGRRHRSASFELSGNFSPQR